jgi:hypothetical protein
MNIKELRDRLSALGMEGQFSVRDVAQPEMRPDNVTVVEPESDGDGWTAYFAERGEVFHKQHFETESAACEYALGIATRPKPPKAVLSQADKVRAESLAEERRRQFRERLAEGQHNGADKE